MVPFWLRHSLDREFGGYFTCPDRDGEIYDTRKYIWLQGRAAWTFSKLYNEVETREEWLEAARLIVEFLRRHAFDAQGRCYFSLTREVSRRSISGNHTRLFSSRSVCLSTPKPRATACTGGKLSICSGVSRAG